MERCDVSDMAHDTANACQDCSETNDGVESGDGLRQIGGRDSLANEESLWDVSLELILRDYWVQSWLYLLEFRDWPRHQTV